jgi:hypothetical protein
MVNCSGFTIRSVVNIVGISLFMSLTSVTAMLVPTFAGRGCRVASTGDPCDRILGFIYRSRQSLGRYSSLEDEDHGLYLVVSFFFVCYWYVTIHVFDIKKTNLYYLHLFLCF